MSVWAAAISICAVAVLACSPFGGGAFVCERDEQCSGSGLDGVCEPTGYCSFADPACASGRRYGELAGGGLGGACVAGALTDAGADSGADAAEPDASPAPPFCDPTDPALVLCMRFEGNADDESQYHNHATATEVAYVGGVDGDAISTSANSLVFVDEDPSLDLPALTIEMWIRPDEIPSSGRAGLLDNQGQYGLFLHPGGALRCTAGSSLSAQADVAAEIWTHVACTSGAGAITVYVNGSPVDSSSSGAPGTGGTTGVSIAGDNPPGSGDPFVGAIDNLRVWSEVRTEQELCAAAAPSC